MNLRDFGTFGSFIREVRALPHDAYTKSGYAVEQPIAWMVGGGAAVLANILDNATRSVLPHVLDDDDRNMLLKYLEFTSSQWMCSFDPRRVFATKNTKEWDEGMDGLRAAQMALFEFIRLYEAIESF